MLSARGSAYLLVHKSEWCYSDFLSTVSIAKQGDNVFGSVIPSVGESNKSLLGEPTLLTGYYQFKKVWCVCNEGPYVENLVDAVDWPLIRDLQSVSMLVIIQVK